MNFKIGTMALLGLAAMATIAQAANTRYDDSLALVAIRAASGNSATSAITPWVDGTPLEGWGGVVITNDRVTRLYLQARPDNNSYGYGLNTVATIPDALCELKELTSFAMTYTTANSLPSCVTAANLPKLTNLEFHYNANLESIPSQITSLSQLTTLRWNYNGSTDNTINVSPDLRSLTNLDTLVLVAHDGNTASNWTLMPSGITDMPKLKDLSLGNQKIDDLKGIGNLTNLQGLTLFNMGLTALPDEIGDLVNLQVLTVRNNALTALPASLSKLTKLGRFRASGNTLLSIPDYIWTWTALIDLELEGSGNTNNTLPEAIGNLVNLTQLSLVNFRIQSLPASMAKLTKLTGLALSKNWLSEFPDYWANNTIYNLDLSDNLLATLPAAYKQDNMHNDDAYNTCDLVLNLSNNYLDAATQAIQTNRFAYITRQLVITIGNQNSASILSDALYTYAWSISAASKPYDATTAAVVFDTLHIISSNIPVYLECPATFASANAGLSIAVTVADKSKCVLTGPGKNTVDISAPLNAYDFGTLTLAAHIYRAPLTVTAKAEEITVGQTPKLEYTVTGLYGSDKLTGALAVNGTKVGSYDITLGTLKGGDNYAITAFNAAKLTIKAATSVIQATQTQGSQWFQAIQASHGTAVLRSLDGRTIWSASLPCSATEVRAQLQTSSDMAILQVGKQSWLVK